MMQSRRIRNLLDHLGHRVTVVSRDGLPPPFTGFLASVDPAAGHDGTACILDVRAVRQPVANGRPAGAASGAASPTAPVPAPAVQRAAVKTTATSSAGGTASEEGLLSRHDGETEAEAGAPVPLTAVASAEVCRDFALDGPAASPTGAGGPGRTGGKPQVLMCTVRLADVEVAFADDDSVHEAASEPSGAPPTVDAELDRVIQHLATSACTRAGPVSPAPTATVAADGKVEAAQTIAAAAAVAPPGPVAVLAEQPSVSVDAPAADRVLRRGSTDLLAATKALRCVGCEAACRERGVSSVLQDAVRAAGQAGGVAGGEETDESIRGDELAPMTGHAEAPPRPPPIDVDHDGGAFFPATGMTSVEEFALMCNSCGSPLRKSGVPPRVAEAVQAAARARQELRAIHDAEARGESTASGIAAESRTSVRAGGGSVGGASRTAPPTAAIDQITGGNSAAHVRAQAAAHEDVDFPQRGSALLWCEMRLRRRIFEVNRELLVSRRHRMQRIQEQRKKDAERRKAQLANLDREPSASLEHPLRQTSPIAPAAGVEARMQDAAAAASAAGGEGNGEPTADVARPPNPPGPTPRDPGVSEMPPEEPAAAAGAAPEAPVADAAESGSPSRRRPRRPPPAAEDLVGRRPSPDRGVAGLDNPQPAGSPAPSGRVRRRRNLEDFDVGEVLELMKLPRAKDLGTWLCKQAMRHIRTTVPGPPSAGAAGGAEQQHDSLSRRALRAAVVRLAAQQFGAVDASALALLRHVRPVGAEGGDDPGPAEQQQRECQWEAAASLILDEAAWLVETAARPQEEEAVLTLMDFLDDDEDDEELRRQAHICGHMTLSASTSLLWSAAALITAVVLTFALDNSSLAPGEPYLDIYLLPAAALVMIVAGLTAKHVWSMYGFGRSPPPLRTVLRHPLSKAAFVLEAVAMLIVVAGLVTRVWSISQTKARFMELAAADDPKLCAYEEAQRCWGWDRCPSLVIENASASADPPPLPGSHKPLVANYTFPVDLPPGCSRCSWLIRNSWHFTWSGRFSSCRGSFSLSNTGAVFLHAVWMVALAVTSLMRVLGHLFFRSSWTTNFGRERRVGMVGLVEGEQDGIGATEDNGGAEAQS